MTERETWLVVDAGGTPTGVSYAGDPNITDRDLADRVLGIGNTVERWVPAPVWRDWDPEDPPAHGLYWCEIRDSDDIGDTFCAEAELGRDGCFDIGIGYEVTRYTDMPAPPPQEDSNDS